MHRPARSRAAVAVITSILSLSLATGCSGTKSDSADDGSGKGSRSTGAAKALSKPELAKSIIAQGDVKGYKVGSADRADAATTSKDDIKVVDEKCEPLAYVLSGFAPGDSTAYVNRQVTEKKAAPSAASDLSEDATEEEFEDALTEGMSVSVTIVSLSSYEGDGAEKATTSVSDALDACANGFKVSSDGDSQKFTKVAEEKSSGEGDDSVAFAVTGDMDGDTGTVHGEVVRRGSVVATYYTLNLGAMMSGKAYDIPAEIIAAQTSKIS
ncbi:MULTISPECIES: hypothetical protein [Streptomyces]|uniref:Secreted protein n=3 Tax=Streptomyces avermitilis TaxID=33903 RepID=Q82DH1_STRAW|nr:MULTISPECIES: hypothetical protein [Streptomyces]MYT00594.1 hypothetical protein [Streptomyces sp. SID5469]OOV30270.1 hypothetical protein SM007_13380 [Streptomyces avermitilis]BAC72723.1 putative secreted protein [Streptomyces avermitilis MA-4680 = NBRC 14893]BBJ53101.1 hypothetical protein SAVMC3_57300 [Streptomyces avermitilis]GDY74677.1 hypothetical protein SAV31267_041620 [Streptomyces avermitilis]